MTHGPGEIDPLRELPRLSPDTTLDQAKSTGALSVCLITLGGRIFAIDLSQVREVFKLESVTPVPGMPPALVGVANLRGTIIPLADFSSTLGTSTSATQNYAVIVRHGTRQVGLLIDDVPEIRTIDTNDLLASSTTDMVVDHPFYSRFFKTKDNVSHMLEVSRLLAAVDEVIGDASTLVQGRNEGDDGATESEPYLGR